MEIIRYVDEDSIEELKAYKTNLIDFIRFSTVKKDWAYKRTEAIKIIIPDKENQNE